MFAFTKWLIAPVVAAGMMFAADSKSASADFGAVRVGGISVAWGGGGYGYPGYHSGYRGGYGYGHGHGFAPVHPYGYSAFRPAYPAPVYHQPGFYSPYSGRNFGYRPYPGCR